MTLILEIPTDLDAQIQAAARAQNTEPGAWLLQAARRALDEPTASGQPADGQTTNGAAPDTSPTVSGSNGDAITGETRAQRRARINAAIDAAQADFAHLIGPPFGDAVSELMACKRADEERAEQRGL